MCILASHALKKKMYIQKVFPICMDGVVLQSDYTILRQKVMCNSAEVLFISDR